MSGNDIDIFRGIVDDLKDYTAEFKQDIKDNINHLNTDFIELKNDIKDNISEIKADMKIIHFEVESLKEKKGLMGKIKSNWTLILLLIFMGRASVEVVDHFATTPMHKPSITLDKLDAHDAHDAHDAPASSTSVATSPGKALNTKINKALTNIIMPNVTGSN